MRKIIIMIFYAGIFLAGCHSFAPIRNIEHQTVTVHNQAQVEKAILAGATRRGWTAHKVQEGLIVATLSRRTHLVEVEIPYDADSYSILYKYSENLRYNEKKNTIHPRLIHGLSI